MISAHGKRILEAFDKMDALLVRAGFDKTSPWWRREIERFYHSNKRQWVIRAGRRAGKSTTLAKLLVCEGLYGLHKSSKGVVLCGMLLAQNKQQARERIVLIKTILEALSIPWVHVEDGAQILRKGKDPSPIDFKVFTASIKSVSGPTTFCIFCDEVSKWHDIETGANPATEVLAAVRPTMATMPNARIWLSSSPLGRHDAHYKAFEEGETPFQCVSAAQSWIANPTITEAGTRLDESDPRIWNREYNIIPSDDIDEGIVSAAELDLVTRMGQEHVLARPGHTYWATMDPATSGNAWTLTLGCMRYVPVTTEDLNGNPRTEQRLKKSVVFFKEWRGTHGQSLRPQQVLGHIADCLLPYRVDTVYSDEWSFESMYDLAALYGITLVMESSNGQKKTDRYRNFALAIRSRQADLPADAQLRQDILNIRRRITKAGEGIDLVKTQDGRHADYAPALSLLFMKPMAPPEDDPAEINSPEWILAQKAERARQYANEQTKSFWKPTSASDRGKGAWWKP